MIKLWVVTFIGLLSISFPIATTAGQPPLKIQAAWAQAVPPGSTATAAFMTLVNPSGKPVNIVAGRSPAVEKVEPMITTRTERDGQVIMGMKTVEALEIPAAGRLELKPGGDHIMLIGLKQALKPGSTIELTLEFKGDFEPITLEVPVRRAAPASSEP